MERGPRTRQCSERQEERAQHRGHGREGYPSPPATSTVATRTDFLVGTRLDLPRTANAGRRATARATWPCCLLLVDRNCCSRTPRSTRGRAVSPRQLSSEARHRRERRPTLSLRSAPCDDVCVAAVYGLDSGPGHHGDHRRCADVQRNGPWEREAETVLLRLTPNAGDRQSRSARRTAYLIGEKSVGLMNIRSTFVTSRPSRCDSSTTVFHSGSSLNTFQDLSASSRFGCARI